MLAEENDKNKSTEQLMTELAELRKQLSQLEKTCQDITRNHHQDLVKLLEERNRAQGYLDVIEVILVVLDPKGDITLINRKGCRILGYENGELIGKNWFETCLPPEINEEVFGVFKQLMRGEIEAVEYYENPVITRSGQQRLIAWHNSILKNETGDIIGILSSGEDITQRQQMEQDLKESEEKYRFLAENATDVIWTMDINLNLTYISPSVEKLRGYTVSEIMAEPIEKSLTPESLKIALSSFKERLELEKKGNRDTSRSEPLQLEYNCKDGSTVWAESTVTYLRNPQGDLIGLMGVIRDITERKEADGKLKTSLKEKELLLKEVHHRVKNNMAIISSLLNLQTDSFTDPAVLAAFRDSQYRIRSMALVHEKLYQARDLSRIDFSEYIRDLANQVARSSEFQDTPVRVEVEAEEIKMTIDAAIPCGLIISELLTNAFKYAFPPTYDNKGDIHIAMRLIPHKTYELIISDNGVGLPEHIDLENPSGFGLNLVHLLTHQLGGEIQVSRQGGTAFRITFPV